MFHVQALFGRKESVLDEIQLHREPRKVTRGNIQNRDDEFGNGQELMMMMIIVVLEMLQNGCDCRNNSWTPEVGQKITVEAVAWMVR